MEFFLEPVYLHLFFASCHILFLVALPLVWYFRSARLSKKDEIKNVKFLYYRATLSTCLILCLFHIFVFFYDIFYWDGDGNGVFFKQLVSLLDLGARAITWLCISAYLHFSFLPSCEKRFPAFLRVWWGIQLLMPCSSIAFNFFCYGKSSMMGTRMWVLDFGSLVFALILNYTGFLGRRVEDKGNHLQESLLNGGLSNPNGEPSKSNSGFGNVSLFANANFLSFLTFSWITPLIALGNKKILDLEDVPQLDHNDTVDGILPTFRGKLESCRKSSCNDSGNGNKESTAHITSFNLAKALLSSSWKLILLTSMYALLDTLASYVGPFLIDYFVQYLNGYQSFANEGYVLVMAFIVAKLIESLTGRHWHFRLQQVALRIRSFLVSIIYQKGLTLSSNAKQGRTTGEIINIMSVDADRIAFFIWYLHDLWTVPVQIVLALLILYARLGLASLSALFATFAVMLLNIPMGKMEEKYQEKMMESKDLRMKSTSEILRNMRILKLQCWEMKFLARIAELRKNETNWLKKYVYIAAMSTSLFWGAPTFVAVATFGTCVLLRIPLESGKVLSALATFRVLQGPIYGLPDTIATVIQTKVSLDRITSFLRLEDIQKDAVENLHKGSSNVAIEVINGKFSWDLSSESLTLNDLNFKILQGMRVAICGTVGSGKSSLLACILGEIPKMDGVVKLCGLKAYVAQSPWIQSGKIQDNILFGKEMNLEKYECP